ncbi:DNA-binding protein [Escherichia coli]|uniref:DNA-binding protein n=1 Tax=Escherichia coli TaxID=562 RepID=UPI0005B46D3F
MARKLVEFDDVAAAAQKLKDAGKRPTVIAIRDIIGKGSFTTISTYLKQWSEEHSLDGVLGIFRPKTTKCSGGRAVRGLQRGITFR